MFNRNGKTEDAKKDGEQAGTTGTEQAAATGTAIGAAKNTAVSNMNFGGVQAGAGMEGADRDSFAIPFLVILQKLSPQLDRNNEAAFIKGATDGMFFNTASREIYSGEEGVLMLPVAFKRSFTAWKLREKGGGFKGEYRPDDPILMTTKKDHKNRDVLPDGETQLVDTRMHSFIMLNGDALSPIIITFSSTQVRKSKRLMSEMQERSKKDNLPTFAHIYKATTVGEKNDQGNWSGWNLNYVGQVEEQEQIDAAVSFYKALQAGSVKMNADTNAQASSNEA